MAEADDVAARLATVEAERYADKERLAALEAWVVRQTEGAGFRSWLPNIIALAAVAGSIVQFGIRPADEKAADAVRAVERLEDSFVAREDLLLLVELQEQKSSSRDAAQAQLLDERESKYDERDARHEKNIAYLDDRRAELNKRLRIVEKKVSKLEGEVE